jgi:hypothetical protein
LPAGAIHFKSTCSHPVKLNSRRSIDVRDVEHRPVGARRGQRPVVPGSEQQLETQLLQNGSGIAFIQPMPLLEPTMKQEPIHQLVYQSRNPFACTKE